MSARLFIAIELSIAVVEQLMELQEELDDALGGEDVVRWVHPEHIHLTLKYLGEVDEALVELLDERMRALVGPLFPFQAECKGVLGAPDASCARTIWATLDGKSGEVLGLLRRALEQELEKIGFAADSRTFKPMMLLGRARDARHEGLLAALDSVSQRNFGASTIKDLVLFRATQDQDGARYDVVQRYVLGDN